MTEKNLIYAENPIEDIQNCTPTSSWLLQIRYHMDVTFLFNTAIARMHEMTSDLKVRPQLVLGNLRLKGQASDIVV